jgi:hypothetical protein
MSKKLGVRSEEYKVKSTAFKGLAKWFETHKPKGKWAWLGSTYEAFHTFAFTPNRVTRR